MKYSLGISNFLEEISSLSHCIVFLYFFALITEEGFLICPCYSLELCIQMIYLSFSPLLFTSLLFTAICKASSDNHFALLHFFFLGMVLIPVSCTMSRISVHSSSGTLSIRSSPDDRMWSTGEGNGKPLQYSCLENPMNSMKRQKDRTFKDELPRSVGAQYATGDQWRNNSRKNEGMEPKQKHHLVVDGTGEVEWFYEDLQDFIALTPKKDVLFIIGDWIAKVGSQETSAVTGKFGLGVQNEAGWRLIEFCQGNTLVIATPSSSNTREDSTHGHLQMVNNEIRLIIFFAAKDGEALYNQQKQDQKLTVAQIMNSLLPNSDLNWRK